MVELVYTAVLETVPTALGVRFPPRVQNLRIERQTKYKPQQLMCYNVLQHYQEVLCLLIMINSCLVASPRDSTNLKG